MNAWRIGINKPVDDSLSVNQELQTVLAISDVGMATSGNYRNFYYKGGKKYAHTIDHAPDTQYNIASCHPLSLQKIAPVPMHTLLLSW